MPFDFALEWSRHTGEEVGAVRARMWIGRELVAVERLGFSGIDDLTFRGDSLNYVYSMLCQAEQQQRDKSAARLVPTLQGYGCRTVLDYGCGLGAVGLGLAEAGFAVTLADVQGRHYGFLFRLAVQTAGQIAIRSIFTLPDYGPWDAILCLGPLGVPEDLLREPRPLIIEPRASLLGGAE